MASGEWRGGWGEGRGAIVTFGVEFKTGRRLFTALALSGFAPGQFQVGKAGNFWKQVFVRLHAKNSGRSLRP